MLSSRVFFPLDIICWIVRSRTYSIIVITDIIANTSTFRCVTLCRKKGSANSEKGIICLELSLSFHGFLKIVGTAFPFFISSELACSKREQTQHGLVAQSVKSWRFLIKTSSKIVLLKTISFMAPQYCALFLSHNGPVLVL